MKTYPGSCLCGAVRFTVAGPLGAPDACHCTQCRKQSGHFWVSTDVPTAALQIADEAQLRWYASSEKVRRGFCGRCGSTVFWDPIHHPTIAIAMGAFDASTGLHVHKHIFTSQQGDYYTIDDGLPQFDRY